MTSATTVVLLQLTSKTNLPRLGVTSNTADVGMTSTSSDLLPEVTSNTTANLSEPPSFYIWTAAFIFLLVHHLSYLLQNHKMRCYQQKIHFYGLKTKKKQLTIANLKPFIFYRSPQYWATPLFSGLFSFTGECGVSQITFW